MTPVDFEDRYRADPDPWHYETSSYERDKYAVTLGACGRGPFHRALELGGSIGVFSALLSPLCRRLETIDSAPSAVRAARVRLVDEPHIAIHRGTIPDDLPHGRFDLVVASEVLYYLTLEEFARTLEALSLRMTAGGRLVAVHWRRGGPERPLSAETVHGSLRIQPWLVRQYGETRSDYLLDVLERR